MPVSLNIDGVERVLKWTPRAEIRNASLLSPVSFRDLRSKKRSRYALCAIVWAALAERDHPFEQPEDLAEHLNTPEHVGKAVDAVAAMLKEAYPPKA